MFLGQYTSFLVGVQGLPEKIKKIYTVAFGEKPWQTSIIFYPQIFQAAKLGSYIRLYTTSLNTNKLIIKKMSSHTNGESKKKRE